MPLHPGHSLFWQFLAALYSKSFKPAREEHISGRQGRVMDEDGIGLVLARATELRSRIASCIHKTSTVQSQRNKSQQEQENRNKNGSFPSLVEVGEADKEEERETDNLLDIRHAFELLEAQLSSLQVLQRQQWYEREAALAEIDDSRKKLLKKLKEYKGEDLEVIHEATAFASEAVEDSNDLLLPPYPTGPPCSLFSDSGYLSCFSSTQKSTKGVITCDQTNEVKKSLPESETQQVQFGSKNSYKGLKFFINAAAKTVLTLVGAISVLTLAGFEPRLTKRLTQVKVFGLLQQQRNETKGAVVQCPPGKVLVVEDGETRCLVKERVEIPFESLIASPDVNYGCG